MFTTRSQMEITDVKDDSWTNYQSEDYNSVFSTLWQNMTWNNVEKDNKSASAFNQLFHQSSDFVFRVAVLWILAVLGFIGNVLVLLWIFVHHKSRSRMNLLILHLTISDILVIALAISPQLAWEYADRQWKLGDFACRLMKFLQTMVISVSNYMVVVLAVDRYCAIRRPLKKPFSVTRLAGTAWFLAIVLNVTNVILYETKEIDGKVYCRNMLYDHPEVYLRTYIAIIAVLVVILPFFIICFTYARIFQKIAEKTSESRKSKRSSIKPGKVQLQATPTSTLPKAKAKTFKMTIVIVASFLLCSTPYFIIDFWRVYGGKPISPMIWAIIASLAVSNSTTNPFVFLGFNSTGQWWLTLCEKGHFRPSRRNYSGTTTLQTHSEHITLESVRIPGEVRCCYCPEDTNVACNHQSNQLLTTTLTKLSETGVSITTNSLVTAKTTTSTITTVLLDSNSDVNSAVNCVVVSTDCNGTSSAL